MTISAEDIATGEAFLTAKTVDDLPPPPDDPPPLSALTDPVWAYVWNELLNPLGKRRPIEFYRFAKANYPNKNWSREQIVYVVTETQRRINQLEAEREGVV